MPGDGAKSSPERQDCDREITPHPTPTSTDELSPKSYPTVPEKLDQSSVAEFVASFERAYKWNEILHEERDVTYIDVFGVEIDDVDGTDERFAVEARVTYGWGEGETDDGGAEVEADGGEKVVYVVAAGYVERIASDDYEYPDPTTEGTVLRCVPKTAD
jgi:hypothetical protein